MKLASVLTTVVLMLLPAAALAEFVDFSVVTSPVDLGSAPDGLTLGDLTMRYEPDGPADFATVDSSGIAGSTNGMLSFDFDDAVQGLCFDFTLLEVPLNLDENGQLPTEVSDGLFIMLKLQLSGVDIGTPIDLTVPAAFLAYFYDEEKKSTFGLASGSFSYSGSVFNQAQMFFSLDAPLFTVENVCYEKATTVAVPAPGACLLAVIGLAGIAGKARRSMA